MRAMDLGAAGVVVPMVSTPEQARFAAEAVRYPPHGIRSFGPVRSYYSQDGNVADPICLVMVETAEAMENLDAIASTPGVDGILVGPMDLGLSFGFDVATAFSLPEKTHDAIDQVVAACRRHNIISASAAFSHEHGRKLKSQGVQMIAGGSDSLLIRAGAAADLKEIRSW
jgi:4-hydroxy-2-oxoheptanedioate aldolase